MDVIVTLTYDPYIPQLNILINGKHPPEYSRLVQYADEDIWMWHNKIWDTLYSELKDDFYVHFIGTNMDAEIIKYYCNLYNHCVGFEFSEFVINDSLQKRLGNLNQYIRKNGIISYSKTIIDAIFILSSDTQLFLNEIKNIDINNLFCSTHIKTFTEKSINLGDTSESYVFALVSDISKGLDLIHKFNSKNPVFLICIGEKNKLIQINESVVAYETTAENILFTIFNCFLWFPLLKAFRLCYTSIQKTNAGKDDFKIICAIEPLAKVAVETNIEVGKSNPILVTFNPPVQNEPKIIFKVLNESIATTNDMCVFGRQAGSTQLEAYRYGSKKPFETITINVLKRNRIKKLILDEDEIILGVGDAKKLQCTYSPLNADNIQDIAWSSTDESVISIDKYGNMNGLSVGSCRIICTAENISAQCYCQVKPYLENLSINFPENKDTLFLEPMQEYEMLITKTPIDSIDSKLLIKSSDCNIANVIGNRIIAKNRGTAIITISNSTKRKNINFSVVVEKKKFKFLKSLFNK